MLYRIYLVNFGYFSCHEFTSYADAVAYVRQTCFEANIVSAATGKAIATYHPINGLNTINYGDN